ncbi:tetratricopeptide repeat protein [Candidatus Hakubella thermalkaliphila]
MLGYALYKLGKFEEAIESFKQAYLLDPDFSLEKAGLIKKTPEAKP